MRKDEKRRFAQLLSEARGKITQDTLASLITAAGGQSVTRGAVGNWESIRSTKLPKRENMILLRSVLKELNRPFRWVDEWLGDTSVDYAVGVNQVAVVGKISAGAWREVDAQSEADFSGLTLPLVIAPSFPGLRQFALAIEGTSMDRIVGDGGFVICVPYWDARRNLTHGDIVVVERKRPDGLVETTLKRLRANGDGKWELWPESTDPRWQRPVRFEPTGDEPKDDEGAIVTITGLAVWKQEKIK